MLIATSTDTHSDLIERATAAGKAVRCEKPVDLSLARALACRKAVSGKGRPVMIGFNRRFDPNFAALKAVLGMAEIGKPEVLSATVKAGPFHRQQPAGTPDQQETARHCAGRTWRWPDHPPSE